MAALMCKAFVTSGKYRVLTCLVRNYFSTSASLRLGDMFQTSPTDYIHVVVCGKNCFLMRYKV